MIVFANLTGKWIELGDNDEIEDTPVEIFVNNNLSKNELNSLNKFLQISHNDFIYHIHISQIQWANDKY